VLATAPKPGEEVYTTPAGEKPLPWEYDAQDVAAYWAQRWAVWVPSPACYRSCSVANAVIARVAGMEVFRRLAAFTPC